MEAFVLLAQRRKRLETAERLAMETLAARGDQKALEKQFKVLSKGD
jgi:hypothetical protein